MREFSFSAQKFSDVDTIGFSTEEYSKLKYGSKRVARYFGVELANKFLEYLEGEGKELKSILEGQKIAIASAPYKFIPVASTVLKDYFVSIFNTEWAEANPSLQDLKIFRGHSYNCDYGALSVEERESRLTGDSFYVDSNFIKDKVLFCVDDVRITGAHERRVKKLLEKSGYTGTVVYIYYAEYTGNGHANIENHLNYGFVKGDSSDLVNINHIIQSDEFKFNTRVTKYILSAKSIEFKNFIDYQTESFRYSLLTYLTGNEYHKIEEFKENVKYLKTKI